MLGEPYLLPPIEVVGVRLSGRLPEGATATDLVLTVTRALRQKGVVETVRRVLRPGPRLRSAFPTGRRSPTCARSTERPPRSSRSTSRRPAYLAGTGRRPRGRPPGRGVRPRQPGCGATGRRRAGVRRRARDRPRDDRADRLRTEEPEAVGAASPRPRARSVPRSPSTGKGTPASRSGRRTDGLPDGAVVIAAITSCTNTSNPSVMVGAGLMAKRAVELGLAPPKWVKTSLAPGSKVVTAYLERAGLLQPLEGIGFEVVGYGCTTCIGNAGPLPPEVAQRGRGDGRLLRRGALAGTGTSRPGSTTRSGRTTSPPRCSCWPTPSPGRMDIDLTRDPLGTSRDGAPVYLRDLWPKAEAVRALVESSLDPSCSARSIGPSPSATGTGTSCRPARPEVPLGAEVDVPPRAAVLRPPGRSTATPTAPSSTGPGCWRSLATRSRPTTSRRRAISRWTARRAATSSNTGSSSGVQHLRNPAGQPRGARSRNVRQRASEEPSRRRKGGRLHDRPPRRYPVHDLRGRPDVPDPERSAPHSRREGLRPGKLARLGGERSAAPRCPGGDRRATSSESTGGTWSGWGCCLSSSRRSGVDELGLTGRESYRITTVGGVPLTPRGELEVRATPEQGTPKSFRVRCRVDSPVEMEYLAEGGLLPVRARESGRLAPLRPARGRSRRIRRRRPSAPPHPSAPTPGSER